jgi:hypothetical protein
LALRAKRQKCSYAFFENALNNRAGEVADQIPNPLAGVEEVRTKDIHAEKDDGNEEGKKGPGLDVELVVGRGLVAHEGKYEGRSEK